MEKTIVKAEAIRSMEAAQRKEMEMDIRKELNQIRLDIYGNASAASSKSQQMRRTLARIKTVINEEALAKKRQSVTARAK